LPFGVSNLTRSVFRSVPGSDFVSGPLLERGFSFGLSASGVDHYVSGFPFRLLIEPPEEYFGTPK
ncbi:hypothetical protein, partial [Streptomyces abikoensis]|uniref:hypothetical protein n=1 Tax=Streptomyces abikoensis TaxID=97398 RepID=UPI0034067D70